MSEYTVGELENMDLRELYDLQFIVAVNRGPTDSFDYMENTIAGPFSFIDMVSAVGLFYKKNMMHLAVIIPAQSMGELPKALDGNTIDFIEARYADILASTAFDIGTSNYTCKAGFIEPTPITEGDDGAK